MTVLLIYAFILGITIASPWWSLLLLVMVAPWNVLAEWYGVDIRLGWAILLMLRTSITFSESGRRVVPPMAVWASTAFVVLGYLRLHVGTGDLPPEDLSGAYRTLVYFAAGAFAIYSALKLTDSRTRLETLAAVAAASLLVASGYGLWEASTEYGDTVASGRIPGTQGNPNFYSAYLALGASVTIVAWRLRIGSRWWLIAALTAILACVLTFSRMGIVACCVGVGMTMQVSRSGRIFNWKLLASGAVIAAVAAFFSADYLAETRRSVSLSKDPSTEDRAALGQAINDWSRMEAVQFALDEWTGAPVWGKGIATFAARNYMANGIYVTTHNTYVQVLAGSGLVGMALFALILGSVITSVPMTTRRYLIPAAAVMGLCGFFGDFIGSIDIFVWIGILLAMLRQLDEEAPARPVAETSLADGFTSVTPLTAS